MTPPIGSVTLDWLTHASQVYPRVLKNELRTGGRIILRTVKSEYRLRVLAGGLDEASGGWFDGKLDTQRAVATLRIPPTGGTCKTEIVK